MGVQVGWVLRGARPMQPFEGSRPEGGDYAYSIGVGVVPLDQFLRRFQLHLLPKGFVRIRNFGFLPNRKRAALLPLCLQLLGGGAAADQTRFLPSPTRNPALVLSPIWQPSAHDCRHCTLPTNL
jgi:hypothetical protein